VTVKLFLVRHGETAWSVSGQHTGRTDIPLTSHGEDEARHLQPLLERVAFTAVFMSPRLRATRTCDLAGLAATAKIEPDLAEWDYGDYEGRRSVDIIKERPGWNVFRDGCPHGETPAQVSDRADRLIERLCGLDGNVALFSHGQFGCALAARWIELPVSDGMHFSLGPASLGTLRFSPSHPSVRVISLWNAVPESSDSPITAIDVSPREVDHLRSPAGAI
jgi:broad specificity phosphatase PhoE